MLKGSFKKCSTMERILTAKQEFRGFSMRDPLVILLEFPFQLVIGLLPIFLNAMELVNPFIVKPVFLLLCPI